MAVANSVVGAGHLSVAVEGAAAEVAGIVVEI